MRKVIYDVDYNKRIFYLLIEGRKVAFYLSNRLSKTFLYYLDKLVLVDFEITAKRKRVGRTWAYQVDYFNQIINLKPRRIIYDLARLRAEMKRVLSKHKYFLFVDFEMTMPGYRKEEFRSEIIQVGYVLAKRNEAPIVTDGYYVMPVTTTTLSKRTKRFLNLDEEEFFVNAKPFTYFYQELKLILKKYKPKIVVWGKNDCMALNDSYPLHKLPRLTRETHFIDLLKLHKDYYNLRDDLGLFKAYKGYYQVDEVQRHDAKDDAAITKMVFDAFIETIK
ncbi:MAG: exonuclease domain-containing protein [Acholeplasmataceae bacterium]